MWLLFVSDKKAVSGPAALRLTEGTCLLGRSEECDLVLRGKRVSRKHAVIENLGGTVTIKDLSSSKRLSVNGEVVKEKLLKPGDKFSIDTLQFKLATNLPAPSAVPSADDIALQPSLDDLAQRIDWRPFRSFFDKLRSSANVREVLERLLDGLLELFGGERGFVLLREGKGMRLVPVVHRSVDNLEEFIAISSTVYKNAIANNRTVYVRDSSQDALCEGALSLAEDGNVRTIICGPLRCSGQILGTIYIDGLAKSAKLAPDQVPFFDTVTGLASEILASSKTRERLFAARGEIRALQRLGRDDERLVLGDGPAADELRNLLKAAVSQDVTVLITGETGTGKEMVARGLHEMSSRCDGPFIPVNCSALPREIIEAELFGAEKGAFTGALERRVGRFELAQGGSLFLDEVGELPLDIQVKLLRVLQERQLTRLGSTEVIPLDFRLICATNADVEGMVREGTLRQDFYYRINVFRILLKPLRERKEDIMPLARHFVDFFAARFRKKSKEFDAAAVKLMADYGWPGNIRELKNAIERAMVIEQSDEISTRALPIGQGMALAKADGEDGSFLETLPVEYEAARHRFEALYLKRCYEQNKGNIAAMARESGLARKTIYKRLEALGITTETS